MTTRRSLFRGSLVLFSAIFFLAGPGAAQAAAARKPAPLEVTYYYMPG